MGRSCRTAFQGAHRPLTSTPWQPAADDGHALLHGAALTRMASCDCGPETSCYGLCTQRIERHHEDLSRGEALAVLRELSGLMQRED
jgi:hypothetical protein